MRRRGGGGPRGGPRGGGGGAHREARAPQPSSSFLAALHAQRAAQAAAPPPPPSPALKRRLEPPPAAAQPPRPPLAPAPRAGSVLGLLRSRELGSGGSFEAAPGAAPDAAPLHLLRGLLASCVRAWEPAPLAALPRALPPHLEYAVPAALCARPCTHGVHLAWNAEGGAAQWAGSGGQWALHPGDSPVTAAAWDASGAHLAWATLGGTGACATLHVAAAVTAAAAAAPPSSALLRLPQTASAWGLAWMAGSSTSSSSSQLCVPLAAGGRVALVRREPTGALSLERTFACHSPSGGGSGRGGSSDALAVCPAALEGQPFTFLAGTRDGRVYLCDTRASGAPSPLLHLPGPISTLSPLPSVSPYALLGAVTHCATAAAQPQQQHFCAVWDIRMSSSSRGSSSGGSSSGSSGRGPLTTLGGFVASHRHRLTVLPECGLIAVYQPTAGVAVCWQASSAAAAAAAGRSLLPTWCSALEAQAAGAGGCGSGSGSVGSARLQVHALALRSLPSGSRGSSSSVGAELLALVNVACEQEGGAGGGGRGGGGGGAAQQPTLALLRFARAGGTERGGTAQVMEEDGDSAAAAVAAEEEEEEDL
jgi:hypothetical protein